MSCIVRRVAARGDRHVEPVDFEASTLADAARHDREGGVYAAFGTWHERRVVRLSDHLDRFEDSARRMGFELHLDRALLLRELCSMLDESQIESARIRLSAHPLDQSAETGMLTAAIESYPGPFASEYGRRRETGVRCATIADSGRTNPRAKQTSWVTDREKLVARQIRDRTEEIYEWLLLDSDSGILEGLASNFYAIIGHGADARLITAADGILYGIARSIVLEVAPPIVPVEPRAPRLAALPEFAEAFVTSASRGIVPVVAMNGRTIGSGEPGDLTRELMRAYDQRSSELEEPICI